MKSSIVYFLSWVWMLLAVACSKGTPEPSFDEQLAKDNAIIDGYLKNQNIVAQTDPDNYGVRYAITSAGNGISPQLADTIITNYTLKLLSGQEIEKSTQPYTALLSSLIWGWQIAFPLLKEGTKATLYIPSGLAYGPTTKGPVPGNSNLIYEVELLKVNSQLKKDTIAINSYLKSKSITALSDPSGLRYVITTAGTGPKPTAKSVVSFTYKGQILSSGEVFDQSQIAIKADLTKIIKGLRIGFQLVPVGSKVTFYIPSTLAYSNRPPQGSSIPRNANLIFDIELKASE